MGVDRRAELSDRRARLSDDDDMPTLDLQVQSPCLDDADFEADALPPTNRNADHHTIVDMNLRTVRFVVVVAVALSVAFAYAFVTNQPSVVASVRNAAHVEARVAFYNALLGTTMFASSKVFEIYSETLIFPTLHTYLHNCSLYPGDAPQRTTSKVKSNVIFWGLKTVTILMNVGTTSLFVSQRTRGTTTAVALAVETHARRLQEQSVPDHVASFFRDADAVDTWGDGASHCSVSRWMQSDVDYTSIAFGFTRRPWSESIAQDVETAEPVVVRVEDCVSGVASLCEDILDRHDIRANEVATLLTHSLPSSAVHSRDTTLQATVKDLSTYLYSTVDGNTQPSKTTLSVQRSRSLNGMVSLAATVNVVRLVAPTSVVCGSSNKCVMVTDTHPPQEISIQQQPASGFITTATTRRGVAHTDGSIQEILSFAVATHQLPDSSSSFSPVVRLAVDAHGSAVFAHNLSTLALRPTPLVTLTTIVLPETSGVKTWLPFDDLSSPAAFTAPCDPLVVSYVRQFQQEARALSPSRIATTMATATLLYLTHDATFVPSEKTRRLATKEETVELTLSISLYSAAPTFAGCGIMVVLMVFVIWRPAARVRLTPNTTPAAQYVQILTDDLYPNVVHKKRLRFVNGEVLPFNEYVVDSIVLHAKRDNNKKIYL